MMKAKKKREKEQAKLRKSKHHKTSLKKVLVTDMSKPNGVIQNPFIVKSRVISKHVSSIIIGIQQPIVQMMNLDADTWYKQYCDPASKTITLEVYDKNG